MTGLAKLLYGINSLVLILLALAFLSFFLVTVDGFDFLAPVVQYATQYLPVLLLPVTISMVVVLLVRYLAKSSEEKVSIGDFLAAIIAIVCQVAALILYRAQGGEVSGDFLTNIPNLQELAPAFAENIAQAEQAVGEAAARAEAAVVEHGADYGFLGVAALQFLAFGFYWFADPDPKAKDAE